MWEPPSIIAIAAFILNLLVLTVGGTWKLSQLDASLLKAISKARDEIEERQDRLSRECGETVAAVREKIVQVELYCRDNFIRRDGFYKVRDEIATNVKELRTEIVDRLDRMEAKIDSSS